MPTMLGHDLVGALAAALATDPQGLPQPGGLVWQSSDAALRVGSALRAAQDKIALSDRARQLDAAAALVPEIARDVAEATLARLERPVEEQRAEAVRDLCACFPAVLAQRVGRPLQRAGLLRGTELFPLSEEHSPATREAFYASLLPKRRPRFRPGEAVPHRADFVFDGLIGFGGFGEVWRVRERSGRVEAMKFCVDAAAARMIEREAETLTALQDRLPRHPNLVSLTAVNTWQPPYWLGFEYLSGGTLEAELAVRSEPMPVTEAMRTFDAILQGVAAAHENGIVHRDLKPGNVLLAANGTPKVSDFGLGKVIVPSESGPMQISAALDASFTGTGFGTLGYVSPEQQEGEPADPADDVFALGVLLFHMLLGSTSAQPRYIREKLASLDEPVPPGVVEAIVACVDQPRGRRPANASALRAILRPHVPGLSAKTPAVTKQGNPTTPAAMAAPRVSRGAQPRSRGKAMLVWFVLVMLLLISVGGLAYIWSDEFRAMLGLEPSDGDATHGEGYGSDSSAAAEEFNAKAEELLAKIREVDATDSVSTLQELEEFLATHGENEALSDGVRERLEAQQRQLDELVRKQAEVSAAAAVKWARIAAGHDPRGTLTELDRLHEHYGDKLVNPAFHAKRQRLARRVAELNGDEATSNGPFAALVESARQRAAESAGVTREPPAVPNDFSGLEPAEQEIALGHNDGNGDTVNGSPDTAEEKQDNDWISWILSTLLPALLIGMLILLVLIILVGAVPL